MSLPHVKPQASVTSSIPFELEAIDHVLLLVDGLEESIAFYESVLGAQLESRLPQYAMAELRAGISHLDLVDVASPAGRWALPEIAGGRNADHIALRTGPTNEGALRAHLAAHDVPVVAERSNEEGQGTSLSLYVRDPSGNLIELMSPAASTR